MVASQSVSHLWGAVRGGESETQTVEDVEQDLPRDVDQAGLGETGGAVGESNPGLTETEPDQAPVQEELSGHQVSQAGPVEQVEQAACREIERGMRVRGE